MALCQFIYGVIKKKLRNERLVHVHYVAIDDLVITTPLKQGGSPTTSLARFRDHILVQSL